MFHIALEYHLCSRSFDNGRPAGILLVMSIINPNINIQLQKNIHYLQFITAVPYLGWLGSRVVSVHWTQVQNGPGSNRRCDAVE